MEGKRICFSPISIGDENKEEIENQTNEIAAIMHQLDSKALVFIGIECARKKDSASSSSSTAASSNAASSSNELDTELMSLINKISAEMKLNPNDVYMLCLYSYASFERQYNKEGIMV